MESSGGSPAESLLDILTRLESKTTGSTERLEGYQKFTKLFKENEINLFDMDVAKNIKRVLTVIRKDIFLPSADTSQCALQVLGVCLHDSEIVSSMSVKDSEDILQSLVDCISTTEEKGTCTRALWCIGKQNLSIQAVSKKVSVIMGALELSIEKFGKLSVTVEHEAINTIARLAEQCPSKMEGESLIWGKILLAMVVHSAIKVRERALNVVESTMKLMKTHRKEIVSGVMPVFKAKVLPELKNLFANKQELFVMRCWGTLVQTFGEELHHGVYINNILPIVELGFKNHSADVKVAAFTAWQQLIDNFATCPNVLGDPKRIKLIMQVFKINNAKQENIAVVKAKVWWHFIWLLGNKITANFDMVAAPFLHFCLGGSRNGDYQNGPTTPRRLQNGASPKTPRMNLSTIGSHNSQLPVFPVLQVFGCEALAHFLGSAQQDASTVEHDFKLDKLRQDVVTGPSFFIKQSPLFITVATEICTSLGKDVPESLLIHIWNCLVMHLRNAIDSPAKLDIRDSLNVLFTQFQLVVHSQVLSSHILLKMFDSVCQLPDKVLSSSAYSVGGNEMINGTPALFLVDLLLTPSLLQSCSGQESFLTLFKSIVASGIGNTSGTLRFLQSVLEIVSRSGKFVEDREMVWKLWHAVITPLLQHFTMTNEVNQGDSLEPNFDGCVQALVFPLEQNLGSMQQNTVRALVKVWAELYRTVNPLASMVTNAAANVICEEVCHRILGLNKEKNLGPENVDLQVNFCHLMTSCLDFSSLGNKSNFNLGAVYSPKKSIKKKPQPLENIHSLVTLFCQLHKHVLDIVGDLEPKKLSISVHPLMNNLIDVYSTIFTHVNSTSIIGHLIDYFAQPLGMLYSESSKKSVVRAFSTAVLQKLEQLWVHICTCLQSRYQGLFDSDLLRQLSPVLEVNFLHSRRTIKNQTVTFWMSTFGTTSALVYPEILKPVLEKVKERSAIPLPGWTSTNTPVIEETPLSQMSQSQVPEPRIPGMPSPHKVHGSFLNKAVSPVRIKSPLKSPISTRVSASAKKIFKGLDTSNDEDFVVIKQSPKKKMVLTEHQREVMKERRVLPAMYNNLEISMDTSLMASHFTTDTQTESSGSTPTPTTENEPFMLFGSSLNKLSGQAKKTTEDNGENESKKGDSSSVMKDVQEDAEENPRNIRSKSKDKIQNGDSESATCSTRLRLRRKSKEIIDEKSEIDDNDRAKDIDIIGKGSKDKSVNRLEKDVIVIEESEPMETQTSQVNLNSDSGTKDVKKSETSEVVLTKESDSVPVSQAAESFGSFPQNVIGFNFSSSTSSREASGSTDISKKATFTEDFQVEAAEAAERVQKSIDTAVSCKDEHSEVELPASEPLLSWTQKLEELSQSPGLKKSPFKKSLSQDSKSPSKKKSPLVKSPRGKFKENLSMKGALDKWVIRSPVKGTDVGITPHLNSETDVRSVLSMTYVEETQSPKKVMEKEKEELNKTNSPSVMETPIKNILEELDVNHGQSNRKLFDSQGSNHGNDMIEDSNLIPASPTSKSFITRCGTPIVRMTRLSDSDLKRFSPSDKIPVKENLTPTKVSDSETQRKKVKYNTDFYKTVGEDESSHEHDDFSDLKPLENDHENDAECNDALSTDNVPQADTKPKEGGETQNEGDGTHTVAVSPTLFSQLNEHNNDIDLKLNGMFELKTEEKSGEIDSCEKSETGSQGFSTDSQSNVAEDNADHMHDSTTPRRGRKRKQVTPRKTSPDDAKSQKKKAAKDEKGIEQPHRKISKRLKEKKERLSQQNSQENENKSIAGSDSKIEEPDSVDDSQSEEKDVDTTFKLDGSEPALDEIHTPRTKRGTKSVKGKNDQNCSENQRKQRKTQSQEEEEEKAVNGLDKNEQHVDDDNAHHPSIKDDDKTKDTETDENKVVDQNADDHTDSTTEQIEMEVDQVAGETTPKSRNTPKQPERRSTTRHKKEVVQKMAQIGSLENRDKLFLDNDSNMDTDELIKKDEKNNLKNTEGNDDHSKNIHESQDPVICVNTIEKGTEKAVNGKMTYISNIYEKEETIKSFKVCQKEAARIEEPENVIDIDSVSKNEVKFVKDKIDKTKPSGKKAKKSLSDLSSQSDDDIPLIQLKNKKSKRKAKTTPSKQVKKLEKDGRRSPVSLRLQSNKFIGTRLRSGQVKVKTSPQSKKSVSLALKRTRMKLRQNVNEKIKESLPNKESVSADVNTKKEEVHKDSDEPLVNIDKVEKEFEKETCQIGEVVEKPEKTSIEKQDKFEPGSIEELFETESSSDKNGAIENLVTQQASNTNETPRKLIEKSKQAASMLMMNSDSKLVLGSRRFEKRKAVARRSILKPSTLIATSKVESPKRADFHPITVGHIYSPTASPSASILKKRRLLDNCDAETDSPPAKQRRVSFAEPLVEEGNAVVPVDTDEPVPTLPTDSESSEKKQTGSQFTQNSSCQSSEGIISQGTYQSTQESQLNNTEPVCPDLVDCEQSVEKILPQLTSSIWSRGLGQLVRARNIKTIGDLSALTEIDILGLPIRSPKVETVRKTLSKFQNLQNKTGKSKDSPRVRLETKILSEGQTSSEVCEDSPVITNDAEIIKDAQDVLSSGSDLADKINGLSQNQGQNKEAGTDQSDSRTDPDTSKKLVENFKQMMSCLEDNITNLDREQLGEVLKSTSSFQASALLAINWKDK